RKPSACARTAQNRERRSRSSRPRSAAKRAFSSRPAATARSRRIRAGRAEIRWLAAGIVVASSYAANEEAALSRMGARLEDDRVKPSDLAGLRPRRRALGLWLRR